MFRVARIFRAVSPFSVFLMDQKNNPALKGVSIGKRAKMLSKMYKELPQKQRRDLVKRAEKHPSMNKKKKRQPKRRTAPTSLEFSKFVKENYHLVKGLNYKKRFAALSQLYALQKPINVDEKLAEMNIPIGKKMSAQEKKKTVSAAVEAITASVEPKPKKASARKSVKKVAKVKKAPAAPKKKGGKKK